jgi:hypothetical protein
MPGQFQYKELRTFRPFAQSALYENANVPSEVRYGQRPSLASRLGKPYVDEADSWPVIPGRSQEAEHVAGRSLWKRFGVTAQ